MLRKVAVVVHNIPAEIYYVTFISNLKQEVSNYLSCLAQNYGQNNGLFRNFICSLF